MKIIIKILILTNLVSCSFRDKEMVEENLFRESLEVRNDFDGDKVSNEVEEDLGRNPLVADIPELIVKYSDGYLIKFTYRNLKTDEESEVEFSTGNRDEVDDCESTPFIKRQSEQKASSIGKFSSHSWGEVDSNRLYWKNKPVMKRSSVHRFVLLYGYLFNDKEYEVSNLSIHLRKSIELEEGDSYREVSGIEMNYRMYNHLSGKYEVLQKNIIDKTIVSGVKEFFDVEITDIDIKSFFNNLINEKLFVVHEIVEYQIPEIQSKYSNLISSIKSKTVPVFINNPLKSRMYHVSLSNGDTFNSILGKLLDDNFKLEDEKLIRIDQFDNSLPKFNYLNELKMLDKNGKWFVLTNELSKHYLKHNFKNEDIISISYILGSSLSSQIDSSDFHFNLSTSTELESSYELGHVSHNSLVHINIKPLRRYGDKVKSWSDTFRNASCNGRSNCISFPYRCDVSFNIFEKFDDLLVLRKDSIKEFEHFFLEIEGDLYSLASLLEEGKIEIFLEDGNPTFLIKDFSKIHLIKDLKNAKLNLVITSNEEQAFNGVKLVSMSGQASYNCPGVVSHLAGSNGWPISVESVGLSQWGSNVNWSLVKKGESRKVREDFLLSFSSSITNYYN